MDKGVVLLLSIVGLIVLVALTTGWTLSMQRRGLQKQSAAMSVVDESMVLSRRNAERVARLVAMAEASAARQAEIVRVLGVLAAWPDGPGGNAEPSAAPDRRGT